MADADVERLTPAFVMFLAKSLEANKIDSRPLLEQCAGRHGQVISI